MRQADLHFVSAGGDDLVSRPCPVVLSFDCGDQSNKFAVRPLKERSARFAPVADEVEHQLVIPALGMGKKDDGFSGSEDFRKAIKQLAKEDRHYLRRRAAGVAKSVEERLPNVRIALAREVILENCEIPISTCFLPA